MQSTAVNPEAGHVIGLPSPNAGFQSASPAISSRSLNALALLEPYYQELQPSASLHTPSGTHYSAADRVPLSQDTSSSVAAVASVGNVVPAQYQHFPGASAAGPSSSGLIMLPNTNPPPPPPPRGSPAVSHSPGNIGGNVHLSMFPRQSFPSFSSLENKPAGSAQLQPQPPQAQPLRPNYGGYSMQQVGQQHLQVQQAQAGGQMLQFPMPIQLQIGPGGVQGQLVMPPGAVRIMNPAAINPSQPKQPVGLLTQFYFSVSNMLATLYVFILFLQRLSQLDGHYDDDDDDDEDDFDDDLDVKQPPGLKNYCTLLLCQ